MVKTYLPQTHFVKSYFHDVFLQCFYAQKCKAKQFIGADELRPMEKTDTDCNQDCVGLLSCSLMCMNLEVLNYLNKGHSISSVFL